LIELYPKKGKHPSRRGHPMLQPKISVVLGFQQQNDALLLDYRLSVPCCPMYVLKDKLVLSTQYAFAVAIATIHRSTSTLTSR